MVVLPEPEFPMITILFIVAFSTSMKIRLRIDERASLSTLCAP